MQCLHDNLMSCPPDEVHLYLIAYRLGHVRTRMEQTCADLGAINGRTTAALTPTTTFASVYERMRSLATVAADVGSSATSASFDGKPQPTAASASAAFWPSASDGNVQQADLAEVRTIDSPIGSGNASADLSRRRLVDVAAPCRLVKSTPAVQTETELTLSSSTSPLPCSAAAAVAAGSRQTPSPWQRRFASSATAGLRQSSATLVTAVCVTVAIVTCRASSLVRNRGCR
jgi:hypothetical protein